MAKIAIGDMNVDKELLSEQLKVLLEIVWDIDEHDERYKLWGIVELIHHILYAMER